MKKRSAILIAVGLSLAMVMAAFGLVMGFTGPSEAGGKVAIKHRKPVVKTVTERHTVHVPAPGGSGGTTSVLSGTSAPTLAPDTADTANTEDTAETEDTVDDNGGGTQTSSDTSDTPVEQETETPEPTETHSESQSPELPSDD